jgi:hypothetical protein
MTFENQSKRSTSSSRRKLSLPVKKKLGVCARPDKPSYAAMKLSVTTANRVFDVCCDHKQLRCGKTTVDLEDLCKKIALGDVNATTKGLPKQLTKYVHRKMTSLTRSAAVH